AAWLVVVHIGQVFRITATEVNRDSTTGGGSRPERRGYEFRSASRHDNRARHDIAGRKDAEPGIRASRHDVNGAEIADRTVQSHDPRLGREMVGSILVELGIERVRGAGDISG